MEASGTPAANEPPDEIGPEGGYRARAMPIRPTEEPALEDEDTDEGNDEGESEEGGPDPFDINDFIYTPEELAEATEEGEGYTIDVGRPDKQTFVQVHPQLAIGASILEAKTGSGVEGNYLIGKKMVGHRSLEGLLRRAELRLMMKRFGGYLLVPVPILDEQRNSWHVSLREAIRRAETEWIRIVAARGQGNYRIHKAGDLDAMPEPVWPNELLDPQQLVRLAFGDERIVDNARHPLIKVLEGRRSV